MTATTIALFLAEILFLATFLSAEPLEIMADAGQIPMVETAYLYASRWRHGMAGSWPFYMSGFFAVAIAVWFWSLKRSVREMIVEGCGLTLFALLVAFLLQPFGTASIVTQFQTETGLLCDGQPPANTIVGIFRSLYTLVTFAVGIVSIRLVLARCLAGKRLGCLTPLILPVVMNLILALIRPWTVGDLTSYWLIQLRDLNPVATLSFAGVLFAAAGMLAAQLIASRHGADTHGLAAKTGHRVSTARMSSG